MDLSNVVGGEHGEPSGSGGGGDDSSGMSENATNNNNSNKDKVHIPIRKIYIHPIPLNVSSHHICIDRESRTNKQTKINIFSR